MIDEAGRLRDTKAMAGAIQAQTDRLGFVGADVKAVATNMVAAPDNAGITAINNRLPAAPASEGNVTSVGSAVSAIATTLSGMVAAVWGYATRKLTSAETDEVPARDMAAVSTPISVVVPVLQGSVYNSLTIQTRELVIPRGDSRTLPIIIDGDWSAWQCWFAAKATPQDAIYTIQPKQCAALVYDASSDKSTGFVDLATTETITLGKQWGEFELRNGSARVTPIQVKITIVQDIIV